MSSLPRLSFVVWLQLFSVLLPGLVICAEVAYLIVPGLLEQLLAANYTPASSVFWIGLGACVSYVVGHGTRTLGFSLAHFATKRISRLRSLSSRSPERVLSIVEGNYGAAAVHDCLNPTRLLKSHTESDGSLRHTLRPGYYNFCKLWLRKHAPEASVDKHELEINVRFALLLPTILAIPVLVLALMIPNRLLSLGGLAWFPLIVAVVVPAGLVLLLLSKGLKAQGYEGLDALTNFVAISLARGLTPSADLGATEAVKTTNSTSDDD